MFGRCWVAVGWLLRCNYMVAHAQTWRETDLNSLGNTELHMLLSITTLTHPLEPGPALMPTNCLGVTFIISLCIRRDTVTMATYYYYVAAWAASGSCCVRGACSYSYSRLFFSLPIYPPCRELILLLAEHSTRLLCFLR